MSHFLTILFFGLAMSLGVQGLTGAIALRFLKANKRNKVVQDSNDRVWDQRPFTRVLSSSASYYTHDRL